jgi:hypothetical protein
MAFFNSPTELVQAAPLSGVQVMADASGVTASNQQAQAIVDRPQDFMTNMNLADQITPMTEGTGTTITSAAGDMVANQLSYAPVTAGEAQTVANVAPQTAQTVDAVQSFDRVANVGQANAQTGEVRPDAVINAPTLDMQGMATGVNADGSTNFTGQALNQTAIQGISNIINTSTVAGKLLAQSLGEGNYTDSKATLQGQMELLSAQFTDGAGNPTIPTWAAGTARSVSRIAAFKGMTGSAATAVMSQAIMEASIPIAQADSQFFQTVTLQNLNNRQQTTINTANVLAKMELANLDTRMTAAVENSKNFMAMDLANLNNEQQAEIINTQARVQSLLEDTKSQNTARMFSADAQNDFSKFYDQLGTQISQFNSSQTNAMRQFNTGEINSASQFNASLENQREQFYKDMQFNVDMANARWRQTIQTTNTEMQFVAAQTDVQNMFNISRESLNRIWDRADAQLDYAWKTSENEADRKNKIAVAQMQIDAEKAAAKAAKPGVAGTVGKLAGTLIGTKAGSSLVVSGLTKLASFALPFLSDARLKEDITYLHTTEAGVNLYSWNWSEKAIDLGAKDMPTVGVLAQEIVRTKPEAVVVDKDGYYRVDYAALNLQHLIRGKHNGL